MLTRSLSICLRVYNRVRTVTDSGELLVPGATVVCKNLQARDKSYKRYLDYSKVPKLEEADLEEQFVRGSGPGGQATNKTNNAVVLRHIPTGLIVKCHETRSVWDNQKRAREIMVTKLDNLLNKELSVEAQISALQKKQQARRDYKRRKREEMKKAFREREGLT